MFVDFNIMKYLISGLGEAWVAPWYST